MKVFSQSLLKNSLGVFFSIAILVGCNKEFNDVGVDVINSNPFTTGATKVSVDVTHKKHHETQSNNLPVYRLGTYNDPIFGKTEASILTTLSIPQPSNLNDTLNFGLKTLFVESKD